MTGSKGTRAGICVTQAYTVAAVSAFFDRRRRRRRVTCLITLNYPRLRCLRPLVGPDDSIWCTTLQDGYWMDKRRCGPAFP